MVSIPGIDLRGAYARRRRDVVAWMRAAPLVVLLLIGLLAPLFHALSVSLSPWDAENDSLGRGVTLDNYVSFFTAHRGGLVLRCLKLAAVVAASLLVLAVPLLSHLRVLDLPGPLALLELVLVVPLFASQALRLYAVRSLMTEESPTASWLWGVVGELQREILFSNVAVGLGLALSYGAFLLLPVLRSLQMIPRTILLAADDIGLRPIRKLTLVMRLSLSGILTGALLFIVAAWFASLEYEILGRQQSVLALIQGLVAAKKVPEAFAFSIVSTAVSFACFAAAFTIARPERLLTNRHGKAVE